MRRSALTTLAQAAVAGCVNPGDCVIDATVGNGHDTLFLAQRVAPQGRVIGFDVQQSALQACAQRLQAAGMDAIVQLHHHGHEHLARWVPDEWFGQVAAVMFNLGYLPGSDKSVITRAETTLPALDQGLGLLRRNGLISLMVYRGHPGADQEVAAIERWMAHLSANYQITRHDSDGPTLFLISAGT